jgi:transposase
MSCFSAAWVKLIAEKENAMRVYSEAAWEQAMKREEIILRAYSKEITWIQAADILGMSYRHLQRVREAYRRVGLNGLHDKRAGKESPRRVPVEVVEEVLMLYREKYFDFNVSHFCEKLREEHSIELSYTWVKTLLQGAGLIAKEKARKKHRRRRERKPLPGMMLHIDGSHHQWFGDERWHDLIVILDDATSEIYYARLVEAESTRTVMEGIWKVVEKKGIFCSLYSDRAGHFFQTPKAGEPVDRQALTQVGRALRELSIRLIPAYSPQARGRSERSFRTWQGRLPQELRIRGIESPEEANRFLTRSYIREFNRKFASPAVDAEASAFVPCTRNDLDRVFSVQTERIVNRDNTVKYKNMTLQIDKPDWRSSMQGCRVIVYQHLDDTITIGYGPQNLGRYSSDGNPLNRVVGKTGVGIRKVTSPFLSQQKTGHIMC